MAFTMHAHSHTAKITLKGHELGHHSALLKSGG